MDTNNFEQIVNDKQNCDNPLLPEFKELYQHYKNVLQKVEQLSIEKVRIEQEMVDINRSLDLATRIDPMTGLANRRSMMEQIDQEFSRAQRHQRTASIILADLDNYRALNEKYGYNAGDDVLIEVARVLKCCLRSEDICARWGGEEFLILLPETGIEGALAVANKIRESVDMTEFKASRPGIHTTISLGVCEYRSHLNIMESLNSAELALRKAKTGGKNRAVIA